MTEQMQTRHSDMIIIGAGGSGLAAAVACAASATAASQKLKITLVEKRRLAGGTMVMLEGLVAGDSPTQARENIRVSADDLFHRHMRYSHWTLDPAIVRTWLNRTGETVRWLESRGIQFGLISMYTDEPPTSWHYARRLGANIVKVLLQECRDLGVEFAFETRAQKIKLDPAGRVTGLEAESGGERVLFEAPVVIIATGGYGGNPEMVARYCGYYSNPLPPAGIEIFHTGDGLRMAFEAGAASEGLGNLLLCGPCFVGGFGVFHLAIEPTVVWVNQAGERFIEEDLGCSPFEAPNAMLRQPGQVCYSLFDDSTKQAVLQNGYIRPTAETVSPIEKIESAIEENRQKGKLKVADSWDEIAAWCGIDAGKLNETLRRYNQYCDQGHDAELAKPAVYLKALRNPPFYAARCYPSHLGSIGGIKINQRMEVLNNEREWIRGLYATGSDTGGWSSATYNRYLAGAGASFALNSGLMAGENAWGYITGLEKKR